eukprot:54026-Chlamydomonas_euryale.AAC.1
MQALHHSSPSSGAPMWRHAWPGGRGPRRGGRDQACTEQRVAVTQAAASGLSVTPAAPCAGAAEQL